jgi:ApaG protein
MVRTSTHNIEVSVEAKYWHEQSAPAENHYFFVYFITIENHSDKTVQLQKRHWDIFDSIGDTRIVDGDGVVGENPVLMPGQRYGYNSGCNLKSELGYMEGYYTFEDLLTKATFNIVIPRFELVVPAKWN